MLDADKRGQTRIDTSRYNAFKIAMISLARSEQYLKQPIAIKLFQLACNLKRIGYAANSDSALAARMQVCDYLIEWSALDLCPERAEEAEQLVDIARGFANFRYDGKHSQITQAKRNELTTQTCIWSDEVLAMSSLLEQE